MLLKSFFDVQPRFFAAVTLHTSICSFFPSSAPLMCKKVTHMHVWLRSQESHAAPNNSHVWTSAHAAVWRGGGRLARRTCRFCFRFVEGTLDQRLCSSWWSDRLWMLLAAGSVIEQSRFQDGVFIRRGESVLNRTNGTGIHILMLTLVTLVALCRLSRSVSSSHSLTAPSEWEWAAVYLHFKCFCMNLN